MDAEGLILIVRFVEQYRLLHRSTSFQLPSYLWGGTGTDRLMAMVAIEPGSFRLRPYFQPVPYLAVDYAVSEVAFSEVRVSDLPLRRRARR